MSIPHAEWIAEINSKPLFTTLGDMKQTGMFKKVTTFGLSSGTTEACSDSTVRRRYSDFDWLYKLLCVRYPALIIPLLPPKGGLLENFSYAERIKGLDRFMKSLSQNVFLKADPSVNHFVSSEYSSSSKWETLKKTASSQCAVNFAARPVIEQYRTYGTELASGDGAGDDEGDQNIIAAYTQLAKTSARAITIVKTALTSLSQSGGASDVATADFQQQMSSIAERIPMGCETSVTAALSEFSKIMSTTSSAIESFATHQTFSVGAVEAHIAPALYEVGMCMSEITAASTRLKALRKALVNAENAKVSAASALAKLEASGKPDKDNKAAGLIVARTAAVESLTQEVKVSVRVLCGVEYNRILIHCCKTLAKATMEYANAMETNETNLSQVWMMAANGLETGTDASAVWKSTVNRLALHGANLEGSWVSVFDVAELDNSSSI